MAGIFYSPPPGLNLFIRYSFAAGATAATIYDASGVNLTYKLCCSFNMICFGNNRSQVTGLNPVIHKCPGGGE